MFSSDQESKGGGFSSSVECLRAAVSSLGSSSFSKTFSDGGTAVAGGGWKRRGKGGTAAQGFSNVRHQEGVARQLQHVHAVLLVISQATSNEGLQEKKKKPIIFGCLLFKTFGNSLFYISEKNDEHTFASVVTTGFGGNCTSVAFNIVFS